MKQLLNTYLIGSRKRQRSSSLHSSDTQSTGHQSEQTQRTRRSRSPISLQSEVE